MSIQMGKYGRLVIPKEMREKYGVKEGSRFIIREYKGQIILIPVTIYEKPTEALHGSIKLETLVDEPKEVARKYIRKKLAEEHR